MSQDQLLMTHQSDSQLPVSNQLHQLFDKSFEVLETILNHETTPASDRAAIALKILEVASRAGAPVAQVVAEPQTEDMQTRLASLAAMSQENVQFQENRQHPHDRSTDAELSQSWRCWIAENRLLNNTEESMVRAMVSSGIDEHLAQREIRHVSAEPSFLVAQKYVQLMNKLESILDAKQKVAELDPGFCTIERRSRLSRQEFFEQYYTRSKPVILTDMMDDWAALSLWTPDYLKEKYGQVVVEIQANRNDDADFEINKAHHKKLVQLSEYADMVVQGGATNDYYLTANNGALDRPGLRGLLNDIVMFPDYLDGSDITNKVFFWFGPAGTLTPLHHDANNLIMAQVVGRKRWRIISPNQTPLMYNHYSVFSQVDGENPDGDRHPLYRQARVLEAVVEPGEAIFIPVGWWHHVKALDMSFSVSFTNFVFPNLYHYKNPELLSW